MIPKYLQPSFTSFVSIACPKKNSKGFCKIHNLISKILLFSESKHLRETEDFNTRPLMLWNYSAWFPKLYQKLLWLTTKKDQREDWYLRLETTNGQTISKWFFQADVSSKKRTNKFDFTTCRLVFVRFLEESEDTKKTFRN